MTNNVIVYVSHNSAVLVVQSIERIGLDYNFCIIENGGDDSYRILSSYVSNSSYKIQLHRTENQGFGAACNFAARANLESNLIYLNPDCYISSYDIALLFNGVAKQPTHVIAPTVYDFNTGIVQNYRYSWTKPWLMPLIWLNLGRFKKDRRKAMAFLDNPPLWVAGSVFAVSSATLRAFDGFDENFFLYFEEEDLFRRIINGGGKCKIEKNASARHEAGTSTSESKSNIREFMLLSGLYYVHKWYGKKKWKALVFICKILIVGKISEIFMPSKDKELLKHRIQHSDRSPIS